MAPVVAFIGSIFAAVGSLVTAVSAWSIGSFAVGKMLVDFAISMVISTIFQTLFKPKNANVAQRQASILDLTLGEHPREAIFGRASTGGSLDNVWNDGTDSEFENFIIRIADHECDAIEGFYLADKYYPLTVQGAQTHADFQDGGPMLWIEWRLGAPGQTTPSIITTNGVAAGQWTAEEAAASWVGITFAAVRYKVSDKVWKNGRPGNQIKWVVRGHKNYDPRLDSTVDGGDGPHRWDDPTTREWDENARSCHYNFVRGVWNYASDPPQLMVGPGRSEDEAPPEKAIADINACAEQVALKAGGTEDRYRVGCVIRADESWIEIEQKFADAMAGQLVERDGTIGVDVGVSKTVVFEFTDKRLLIGREILYQAKVGRREMANSVLARFVDPSQLWEAASAPLRRSAEDIEADTEPRDSTLELEFVTSGTQAQRIAEIARRRARLQTTAGVILGPEFQLLEDGDWGEWTSDRRFGGDTRTFEVQGAAHDDKGTTGLALRAIAESVFAWNAAVDELDLEQPAYLPPGAAEAAAIADFDAEPLEITSEDGISGGAIRATWTPPNDVTVTGVRLEYRPKGGVASATVTVPPQLGEHIISVLPVTDVDYEIRATPTVSPRRDTLTTAWRDVLLSAPFNDPEPPLNFVGYQSGDLIRFVWTAYQDTTLRYEIRCGPTFELGRYVDNVAGGSTAVVWPIASEDDDLLFWIKTVHRSGVYSAQASLWVAAPNDLTGRNFVLAEDFQAEGFPGIRHALTDTYIGDLPMLELDQGDGGLTATRGDYYAEIELVDQFSARTWLEHRASAYVNDLPAWEDTEDEWEDLDETDWEPAIGDPGGDATLDAYIALSSADLPDSLVEGFRFDGSLEGARGLDPAAQSGITYAPAKAAQGVVVAGELRYEQTLEAQFSVLFDLRLIGAAPGADATAINLTNGDGAFLKLYWRASDERWVLAGNFAAEAELALPWTADDTVSVGIWQSTTGRGLTLASRLNTTPLTASVTLQ